MNHLKIFSFFSFLLTLYFFNYTRIFASNFLFYDNFSDIREQWYVLSGDWEGYQDNSDLGYLKVNIEEKDNRAILLPQELSDMQDWTNYVVELKIKSVSGVDQHIWFRAKEDQNKFSMYSVDLRTSGWTDSNNIRIFKSQLYKGETNKNHIWPDHQISPSDIGCSLKNEIWYPLKIKLDNNRIEVYIKCPGYEHFNKIYEKIDVNDPFESGGIGVEAWSGSWYKGVEKWFDDIKVYIEEDEEKHPLILIPGITASWNTQAMVYGEDVPVKEWDLIPFAVPVYQPLIDSIKANGYTEGQDFFVWPYDWRKRLDLIQGSLDEFISDEPELSQASKIDFIGHSLGGLVSRNWAQNNEERAGKVVTVGSPHHGAVQAYQALAGGRIGEQRDLEWIGMQLLVYLNRDKFESNAQVIRNIAPILKDLTPTFDYLEKDQQILGWSAVSYVNDYLNNLNQEALVNGFDQQMNYVIGQGKEVPSWLILGSRSLVDQLLDKWPDGKMQQVIFDNGDGTVLFSSAHLNDDYSSFDYYHKELVEKENSIQEILKLLGLDNPNIVQVDASLSDELIVFYLASPANLKIFDDLENKYIYPDNPDLQMIVLPYPESQNRYKAEITGTGDGIYHLYVGEILSNETKWQTHQAEITIGETQEYILAPPNSQTYFERAIKIIKSINNYQNKPWLLQAVLDLENLDPDQASYSLARYSFNLNNSQIQEWEKIKSAINQIQLGWEKMLEGEKFDIAAAQSRKSLAYRLIRKSHQKQQVKIKSIVWQQAVNWLKTAEETNPLVYIADNFFQASYLNWEN